MPCNIGYKTYVPVRIPQPKPQTLKKKMPAPKVDQDLLNKLGVDDPGFVTWIDKLDTKPLLEEALKRPREELAKTNSPAIEDVEEPERERN